MKIGVDIGGTFTDLVLSNNGTLRVYKLSSTPDDPSRAMLEGLRFLSGDLSRIEQVSHGSTVATNAILERKGAKTALITTAGFRDLLLIGRQNRPDLYALHPTVPPPLIPREHSYELEERIGADGVVITPLDDTTLDALLECLANAGYESLAVCLLFSYAKPDHEQRIRARAIERGLFRAEQIALSHEVLPEFREYERASTTALEGYVRPVMDRYLGALERAIPCPLLIMKSDGGVISAGEARKHAILTALSGPAAGVIGAHLIATTAGFRRVITLDIGGTSTDVALIPGEPITRAESAIDGLPLRTRVIDIETVGAGGGSIARIDSGGALQVGPQSAGAQPGPIAYGRGGTQVTVTDANLVLGRLDAEHFLGGKMRLDIDSAHTAVENLGAALGIPKDEAAHGVIQLANTSIERAVRRVSIARGHDPREFTLVAFGGAGGLHACEVAERLDIPRVLIPPAPGVLCAFGLLAADVRLEYRDSVLMTDADALTKAAETIERFIQTANADLEREGIPAEQRHFIPLIDARYLGQAYELTIRLTDTPNATFGAAHEAAYGYRLDRPVEIVNVRLEAIGMVEKPALTADPIIPNDGSAARIGERTAVMLYDRDRLIPGARFSGAALIVQMDSTTYLPPGWNAEMDAYHNLILTRGA